MHVTAYILYINKAYTRHCHIWRIQLTDLNICPNFKAAPRILDNESANLLAF